MIKEHCKGQAGSGSGIPVHEVEYYEQDGIMKGDTVRAMFIIV